MFEQVTYNCPSCGYAVGEHLRDGETFTCSTCQGRFIVALDEATGRAAFRESRCWARPRTSAICSSAGGTSQRRGRC